MYPANALYPGIAARLAADPAALGLSTFLATVPIIAPYSPSVTRVVADLTLGTGSLAKLASTTLPSTGLDPVSGQYKILVNPPAGGWKWAYDGATPAPPVNVWGYALVDAATGLLLMGVTQNLFTPIVLAGAALLIQDEMSFLLVLPPLQ